MGEKIAKKIVLSRRRITILAVTSILLTLAMVFGYQIEKFSVIDVKWFTVAALVCGSIVVFLFLYALFTFLDNIKIKKKYEKSISEWKVFLLVLAILLLMYSISFLALYPGLFVFDAKWQYDMYRGIEPFTEHHPVLHTLIMGFIIDTVYQLTDRFNWSVAVYIGLQMLVCSVSFSYMINYIFKKTKSVIIMALSILFVSLHPALVLQVMSVTKDTMFLAFLMLAIVLSLELIDDTKQFFNKPVKIILWVLSTVLMIIFRNNCLYAVPFLLILLFVQIKSKENWKKYVGMVALAAVLFVLYKSVLVPAVITEKTDGREMLSVPIQQLMRIYYADDADITDNEKEIIENLFAEGGRVGYDPKISDYPKAGLNMDYYQNNKTEINEMYMNLIKRNPKMSIESVVENTCGFWYPFSRLAWTWGARGYWLITDLSGLTVPSSKIPIVYEYYKGFEEYKYDKSELVTMFLGAPATYMYIFLVLFAYAIEQKKKSYYAVFTFVLMLWCTYLLGPVALVRYTIYLYAMVPLYSAMVIKTEAQHDS